MKKKIYSFILLMLVLPSAFAIVGVRPASYEINFEPNLKRVFSFTFIGDENSVFQIYAEGPFSEYVQLSKTSLKGTGQVNALLQLPSDFEKPGRHRLLIGANQASEGGVGVGIVGNPQGVIFVNVPYPGKYAELFFDVKNVNFGGESPYELKVFSKGKESIDAKITIQVYDSSDNLLVVEDFGTKQIKPTEFAELKGKLKTSSLSSGDYKAKLVVDYGEGITTEDKIFRIGKLFIEIKNNSNVLERDKINRFQIEIESFWNDEISGVYANVSILNYSDLDFLTPSITVQPWSSATLLGFFDTSTITGDEIDAKITLHYSNQTTEKIVRLIFAKEESEFNLLVIGAIVAIVIMAILIVIAILFFRRKNEKKKK